MGLNIQMLHRLHRSANRELKFGPLLLALLLAACSSTPTRDGPGTNPPPRLHETPDATPRVERPRAGGPNKPYAIGGRTYRPLQGDPAMSEKGLASWYGRKFHGRPTANGETYDMYAMTAAHKTMPLPSYARVRNPANGREIIVRVNDRGPFHPGRVIDLSYTAAAKLGVLNAVSPVEVQRITNEEIGRGNWQRDAGTAPAPTDAMTPDAASAFWVQLGAFRQQEGALQFQRQVADDANWLAPVLEVVSESELFRLLAGPYATRAAADDTASRIRDALRLVPVVVARP